MRGLDLKALGLAGRRVLVTGASRGIGEGVAAAFVAAGARVTILAEDEAVAATAARLGAGADHPVAALRCDVTDAAAVAAAASGADGLDVLVNNAGMEFQTRLADAGALAVLERTLAVNVAGMFAITQALLPRLGEGGAIINISTYAAYEPDHKFPTSGVFRAGLAAFTKLFADQYAADNVRMNNVLPGFIDSLPEQDQFRARIPMGRYGRAEEIAATIAFLASEGAGYITGQNLRVDGGITRSV